MSSQPSSGEGRTVSRWRYMGIAALVFLPYVMVHVLYHETAHWAVGRAGGFRSTLHYSATGGEPGDPMRTRYVARVREHVESGEARLPDDEEFVHLHRRAIASTAAGPISTVVVGTLGVLWLFIRRRGVRRDAPLRRDEWVASFLGLAWIREALWLGPGLLAVALSIPLANGGRSVDEGRIAWGLGLSPTWMLVGAGLVGTIVCVAIVRNLHPVGRRWQFAVGAIVGAVVGGVLWFQGLGPLLLP